MKRKHFLATAAAAILFAVSAFASGGFQGLDRTLNGLVAHFSGTSGDAFLPLPQSGTWTPSVNSCSGGTTSTTSASGKWRKYGPIVVLEYTFVFNQSGSPTGNMSFSNSPYANDAPDSIFFPIRQSANSGVNWFAFQGAASATISIGTDTRGTALACSAVTTGTTFSGVFIYTTTAP